MSPRRRECQDDMVITNLLTQTDNGVFNNGFRSPQGFTPTDIQHETFEDFLAPVSMVTSGGTVRRKTFSSFAMIANGRVSVLATVTKSDGIAVTLSPWLIHTSSSGLPLSSSISWNTTEQFAGFADFNLRITELALVRGFHCATELHRHGLHAVADAENWHRR